eukprot:5591911-Amphidinium_carterae.11
MGAWVLESVRHTLGRSESKILQEDAARINMVDSVATKRKINNAKISPAPNAHYAQLRPETAILGVGNDEDFGNIFESAATIAILKRNLRQVRMILIAIILKLPQAESHIQDIRCVITSGHVGDRRTSSSETETDHLCRPGESLDTEWWKQTKLSAPRTRTAGESMPEPTSTPMSYGGDESSGGAPQPAAEDRDLQGEQER